MATAFSIVAPSLSITVLLLVLKWISMKYGAGILISVFAKFLLIASTFVTTFILYFVYAPKLNVVFILDPPLFYDMMYALGKISFGTAVFGVLVFAFMLWIVLLWGMLPKPCIVGEGGDVSQCANVITRYPHWLWSVVITYAITMTFGIGLVNINKHLYELNPAYPFIPLLFVVLCLIVLIRSSGKLFAPVVLEGEGSGIATA